MLAGFMLADGFDKSYWWGWLLGWAFACATFHGAMYDDD